MTITRLRKILDDNNIPRHTYSIGEPKEDTYCIEEINGLWAGYTVERGKKYDCEVFVSLDKASEWLLSKLLAKHFSE